MRPAPDRLVPPEIVVGSVGGCGPDNRGHPALRYHIDQLPRLLQGVDGRRPPVHIPIHGEREGQRRRRSEVVHRQVEVEGSGVALPILYVELRREEEHKAPKLMPPGDLLPPIRVAGHRSEVVHGLHPDQPGPGRCGPLRVALPVPEGGTRRLYTRIQIRQHVIKAL